MTQTRPSASTVATWLLTIVALLLFARLAQRHVGESYFLADQVDHLQNYEAALRLEPVGLWGPAMSGSEARALGPFASIVFGLPLSLGFGIDSIHALTSLLLAITAAIAFYQLARVSTVLAWVWFALFSSLRIVWWNAAMFWMNTLQLPLGLLLLAMFVACLRRPSVPKLLAMILILALAVQGHLVALVGLPLVVVLVAITGREAIGSPRSRITTMALGFIVLASFIPYLFAEARTGFRNTQAMFSHVEAVAHADGSAGHTAAVESLVLATDPLTLMTESSPTPPIAIAGLISIIALALLLWKRRAASDETTRQLASTISWLVTAAVIAVAGQALFFLSMARRLNGLHYVTLLSPWYAIPPAALVAALVPSGNRALPRYVSAALGLITVLLLMFRAPVLADRYAERTAWTYRAIVGALDSLCADQSVDTLEGPGLIPEATPSYDSVLRYLMKRGYSRCRYQSGADVLIVANRSNSFDQLVEHDGRQFRREQLLAPGIARYRRAE